MPFLRIWQLIKNLVKHNSGGFFRKLMSCLSNSKSDLDKKAVFDFAIPLDGDHLSKMTSNLVIKATLTTTMILKKISGKGDAGTGRIFTLFILNEDMDNVIKIVESLEKWALLIDVATKTVKHEIR